MATYLHQLINLLTDAEAAIFKNAPDMLPRQRQKMIDLVSIAMSHLHESDFLTYAAIKNIVENVLIRYESSAELWQIDADLCTDTEIALKNSKTGKSVCIPADIFMAAVIVSNRTN